MDLSSHENYLILGDGAAVSAAVSPGSFDLIYIDPPFGTGSARSGKLRTNGKTASYSDHMTCPIEFTEWLTPTLENSRLALSDRGSLVVHLDYRTVHYVKVRLDSIFGRENFVNEIIWCYSTGGKSSRAFGRKHDTLLWYARSEDYYFAPDDVRVERKSGSHMKVVTNEEGELVQEKTDRKTGKVYHYPLAAGKVPEDWWSDIQTLNHSAKERVGWPTQKPVKLLERIVLGLCPEHGRVGDWFCGSGTTAVASQSLGRRFAVSDRNTDAIETARRRMRPEPVVVKSPTFLQPHPATLPFAQRPTKET